MREKNRTPSPPPRPPFSFSDTRGQADSNTVGAPDLFVSSSELALDAATKRQFVGHSSAVWSVCYSPDGKLIASASSDQSIRVWSKSGLEYETQFQMVLLPNSNWVVWSRPDQPSRDWEHRSDDAWRWLGWLAPLPDGSGVTRYPMSYFIE